MPSKIKTIDLPKDQQLSDEELDKVSGGLSISNCGTALNMTLPPSRPPSRPGLADLAGPAMASVNTIPANENH